MKVPWLLTIIGTLTLVSCISQFEDNVDDSINRVSSLLADDALSTETYKVHPAVHLLDINSLRYSVMGLTTSIRETLIKKYARPQHLMTTQQAYLIKLFELKFSDLPLPNVFTVPYLQRLEAQLREMKWQLSTAQSHLKPGWLNIRTDYSAMLITCIRIVKDYVERYNSIRLLGDAPPPYRDSLVHSYPPQEWVSCSNASCKSVIYGSQ